MYIQQDCYSDELREEVHYTLKVLGVVKSSLKKLNSKSNLTTVSKKIFNTPISHLDRQPVLLRHSGAIVHIPSFLINACNHLRSDLTVEGIFRKAGSTIRQKEIKTRLENGGGLMADDHVIDVANVLKYFLRELPEPLIPYSLHETLLKCLYLKGREDDAVLLTCLLLPAEHLDCLTYLIEFLSEVIALKDCNKMGSYNLAVVFAPSIMPIKNNSSQVLLNQNTTNHTKICKILLENACLLGSVPDFICEKLSLDTQSNHRRRRNSGSITRMFSGFKKMVGKVSSGASDSNLNSKCNVPVTPSSNANHAVPVLSAKKRKVLDTSTPFSLKKRREVLRCLPEESLLPKSPMVPKCLSSRLKIAESRSSNNKSSDSEDILRDCATGSRDNLFMHNENPTHTSKDHHQEAIRGSHSALSRFSDYSRRKLKAAKQLSKSSSLNALTPDVHAEKPLISTPRRLAMSQSSCYSQFMEDDVVCVPKKEYDEIKTRLSEIESRINTEFNSIGVPLSDSDGSQEDLRAPSEVDKVQSQYQKTLLEAGRLSDCSTDTIAQHLSRELKIRHSSGSRVMRSPSLRKIGSIRRRSQERVPKTQLSRQASLNLHKTKTAQLYRSRSLQRGKPNSVSSGLQQISVNGMKLGRSFSDNNRKRPTIKKTPQPIMLKNASVVKSNPSINTKPNDVKAGPREEWKSAESFLANEGIENKSHWLHSDKRESIKQIRAKNAGMVMEKAKMFSHIADRMGAPPRRAQSSGNFVTCIKLNTVDSNIQNRKEHLPKILEPPRISGKENRRSGAKESVVSPSVCKTPVSSFLHRNQQLIGSPSSSAKKRRQVMRTQSERTPHKTIIAIGTPRRSPRLNDLKKL
nr:PREDICTED: uncharacterized protein LOC109032092 [Bemisia tabaci]